ncbi:MAG TPA: CHASE domain-containing protein [Caulobacteraceae bacterium]
MLNDLKSRLLRPEVPPWIILLVGLLATIGAAQLVRQRTAAADEARFERAVDGAVTTIDRRLETYVALLNGAAGLMSASDSVSPREFRAYVIQMNLPRKYPGVQGFGFARWLGGDPALALQLGVSPWPDPVRPASAILVLEPMNRRNQTAIGFDMYSEPIRRAAMDRARATGQATTSGRVTLVQELDVLKQPGFLIYVPVARQRPDGSRTFLGWVYSPFRAFDLFNQAFSGSSLLEELDVEVYDGRPGGDEALFDSSQGLTSGGLTAERTYQAPGRTWTLRFAARPAFRQSGWKDALPVIITGLALTLSLVFASWLQAHGLRRSRLAEAEAREAKERTELLLKEVNHRVANSLQLVASLLDLQRDAVADTEAKGALTDTRARVMAVARVHQRLYVSDEVARVDLCGYLSSLAEELESSLDARQGRLKLIGESVLVDTDKAVSAGVVVAELVTNAIKYAYPKNVPGEVRIRLSAEEQHVRLSVEDDGVGMPQSGDRHGTGLGMRIVRAMVKNLDGQLEAGPAGGGARFTVTFPTTRGG